MESGKTFNDDIRRTTTANRRLAKKQVPGLHEALCFVLSSVLADSLVIQNPLLRQRHNVIVMSGVKRSVS